MCRLDTMNHPFVEFCFRNDKIRHCYGCLSALCFVSAPVSRLVASLIWVVVGGHRSSPSVRSPTNPSSCPQPVPGTFYVQLCVQSFVNVFVNQLCCKFFLYSWTLVPVFWTWIYQLQWVFQSNFESIEMFIGCVF